MARIEGAFAAVLLSEGKLIGFRDPDGIRPLVLGRLDGDYLLASEDCAFDLLGAELVRELQPGRARRRGRRGRAGRAGGRAARRRRALHLRVHLLRPAGLEPARRRAARRAGAHGRAAGREAPAEADLVMAIPDSGTPAAIGFARASGIPFQEGLIKNRYVGRTFIQPDQGLRERGIRMKFNPLAEVRGKRVVVVDDSIVRGSTTRQIVAMLFESGAHRGARARLVAADRLALLLRDRHGRRGRADRRRPRGRGRPRGDRRHAASPTSRSRPAGGDAPARPTPSAAPA